MTAKSLAGSVDPDDAPELTDEFFDTAEVFDGDHFIRRGRGRPKVAARKEQVSVRLDPDVLSKLREAGPRWQSRFKLLLRDPRNLNEKPLEQHRPKG